MPLRNAPALSCITLALALSASAARAQSGADANTLGFGDDMRLSATASSFLFAKGLYANYQVGYGGAFSMESWNGGRGSAKMAAGFGATVTRMGLNQTQFLSTFKPLTGGTPTSASGSGWLYELGANLRVLLPGYFLTPTFVAGLGFFDFAPGKVTYQSTTGGGTARPLSGSGPELTGGAALDRAITARTAIFGEGSIALGYDSRTGYGGGIITVQSCNATTCGTLDHQKWVTMGHVRGGVRITM